MSTAWLLLIALEKGKKYILLPSIFSTLLPFDGAGRLSDPEDVDGIVYVVLGLRTSFHQTLGSK